MLPETVKSLISRFLCRYKNVQDFFVADASGFSVPETERKFLTADNIAEFEKLCNEYNFSVPDCNPAERFENGDSFCLIAEDGHYGCWGWVCSGRRFYILEIDRYDDVPSDCIALYHFFTNENFRRQGYYRDLLRMIVASTDKKYAFIYAYDTNPASSGAIKKAGFTFAGRYGHGNYPGLENMIDKNVK